MNTIFRHHNTSFRWGYLAWKDGYFESAWIYIVDDFGNLIRAKTLFPIL